MNYSINPNNRKKYPIPNILDDKDNIELFIKKNTLINYTMKMKN